MATLLSPEVHDAAERSVLCWLATVDAAGQPNVSPKEIFAIADSEHLVVANIASPATARNIDANPKVCLSFIDVLVQKGFKVAGIATHIRRMDPEFARWAAPLYALSGDRFPLLGIFVIRVTSVEQIVAPSYRLYPSETTEKSQIASALRAYGVIQSESA